MCTVLMWRINTVVTLAVQCYLGGVVALEPLAYIPVNLSSCRKHLYRQCFFPSLPDADPSDISGLTLTYLDLPRLVDIMSHTMIQTNLVLSPTPTCLSFSLTPSSPYSLQPSGTFTYPYPRSPIPIPSPINSSVHKFT